MTEESRARDDPGFVDKTNLRENDEIDNAFIFGHAFLKITTEDKFL